jgi:hypothetical protein
MQEVHLCNPTAAGAAAAAVVVGTAASRPSPFKAAPLARKALAAAPAPPPSTSVPPTPDILMGNVQPGSTLNAQVQHYIADSDAPAARGATGGEGSHAVEVKQELDEAPHGTFHLPFGSHSGGAETSIAGGGPVQGPGQTLSERVVSYPNPPPLTRLAVEHQATPVHPVALALRGASLGAGQQAAPSPVMAVGRGLRSASRQARGAAQGPPPAGDMFSDQEEEEEDECQEEEVGAGQGSDCSDSELAAAASQAAPAWQPHSPNALLIPLPFRVARQFSSVALELDSVLLPR